MATADMHSASRAPSAESAAAPIAGQTDLGPAAPKSVPELSRTLRPRHVALIALGGVVGAGLFVGSSASIAAVGPAVVLSYMAAGAIIYALMMMLGELSASFPKVQAFPDLIRAAAGPGLGFLLGWIYWLLWTVAISIEALAGAALLHDWINLPTWSIGALLILAVMTINLFPTRTYGEFEFWFSSVKVAAIVLFVIIAAVYCFGTHSARVMSWSNLTGHQGFMPHGVSSVISGIVTVFFSLTGAEVATIAAAESEHGRLGNHFAAALIGRIVLFYVASIFLIVSVVPWTAIVPGNSPFTAALKAMSFKSAETLMAVIIGTALLSCLNSAFYVASRALFSLASHGDAPLSAVRLNSRRVPVRSVLIAAAMGMLGLVVAFEFPKAAFTFLINETGTLVVFVYAVVCAAYLLHYHRASAPIDVSRARKRRMLSWMAYTTLALLTAVLAAMAVSPELGPQLYASIALLIAFAGTYAMRRR